MLFCGRKLTAQEACSRGLVSQVFWPTTFSQEVMLRVKEMASCSAVVRNQTPLWLNYVSQRPGVLPRLITSEARVLSLHNHNSRRGITAENLDMDQWAHGVFGGRESYFLSPSSHLFSMSGTSFSKILKEDFSISFLHEGGRVWKQYSCTGKSPQGQ